MIPTTWMKPPRPLPTHSLRFRKWGNAVTLLLLAGYLIFCHGCHGADVDDELCVPPLCIGERGALAP
ncbi:MAG: hypothetical protein ACRELF_27790 [Gemmataceae bacterium]